MKKLLFAFSIIMCASLSGFSQALKPVTIDDQVSVSLPSDFTKQDTLGQQIYNGNAEFGYITVIHAPNPANTHVLKKENDLNTVFKEYVDKVLKSSGSGTINNDRDTVINNNLKARTFMLETDDDNGHNYRQFLVVYTTPATYTFEYLYPDGRQDNARAEIKKFFSSVKFAADVNRADQYISSGGSSVFSSGLFYGVAGGILVILIIVLITVRNRDRVYPS
jgi:hypothetical protein